MPRRQRDPVEEAIRRFLVLPFILLVGIYVIGAVVESFFGIPKAATLIFLGVGGLGFLIYYYREWIRKILMRR